MIETSPQVKESPNSEIYWSLLERVAASPELRRAPRLREFLFYVGRRALKDGCAQVHELEIGVAVFRRPDTYDTSIDNIARANATELRKRIEAYFESEGIDETLLMEIPRGSYVPVFRSRPAKQLPISIAEPPTIAADRIAAPPLGGGGLAVLGQRPWQLGALGVFTLAIACCFALWIQNRDLQRLLYPWRYSPSVGALWSAFMDTNQETDIVMEDDAFLLVQNLGKQTFSFNDYLNRTYVGKLQAQDFSPEIHRAQTLIAGKTLARAAEVRLVQSILKLGSLGKRINLYNAREYMPELLTKDNVILFGSPTSNPWDELFESRLNFTEEPNSDYQSPVINHSPATGEQAIYTPTETVGYCVVAYLPKPDHNGKILLIEGTSSEGTEAGGNFLLSEDQLSNFRKKLNTDKFPFFEVLLKVPHVTGTPLTATVEAYRVYPDLR